ncbi:MAG: phage tail spike protein [Clostridiaceae bacterium]
MIKIYDSTEMDFTHNGICILEPSYCVVEEDLNGIYELEVEHPIDTSDRWQHLIAGNIIKVSTPQGDQLFRIYRKQKTMNSVYVNARHIFYDLVDNFLEDVRPTNLNGASTLDWILSNTQYPHNFKSTSDIETLNTAYFIRKNPVEAINTVIEKWGGELVRDNYIIKLLTQMGEDRGVTIRYGKNLIGIEEELDLDSVITKLVPQGFDGLLLPERYIDSPLINNYPHPKIRKFEFSNVKIDEENGITEEKAVNELRKVATDWMDKNKVDIPKVNYRVDFIELSKTEEYKDYAVLERVYLGDIVTVKHEKLGFDLKSKVIKYRWDSIREKYIEIELGNFKENIADSFRDIDKTLNEISDAMEIGKSDLSKAIDNATDLLTTAMSGYVLKRENEILIMDTKDVMTAKKVWRWNVNGLGYSNTGVNGQYGLAMTMDGAIVADFITTGVLNANLIKTGLLKSKKGNTWINMEDGTFSFADRVKFDGNIFNINISGTEAEKQINDKVAETEKNAKEYTDTNIDDVNTEMEKVTEKISNVELKVTPDAIISTVTESNRFLKYTLTPKSSKISIERTGLSLNPLEAYNFTGGTIHQANEPIIIKSPETIYNYLAEVQVNDTNIHTYDNVQDIYKEVKTEIKQTADKISLVVKEDNSINGDSLVSAINMSSRKIEMKSLNIDLTGYVTFNSLSQSGKTTINGDNIRTGKVASLNGYSYFDLANNRFMIGNGSNYLMYFDGSNLNFGSNVSLSWGNLPSSVASTNDIVSEYRVTQITNNAISTASISANQITTGTLATEMLLGNVLNFNNGHSIDNRNNAFRFRYSDYSYMLINGDTTSFYINGGLRAEVRQDGFYNVRNGVGYKLSEAGGTSLIPKFG